LGGRALRAFGLIGPWALGYGLFGLAVFGFFFVRDFPYRALLRAVAGPLGVSVDYQAQQFALPLGVRLSGVRLRTEAAGPGPIVVQVPEATLAPALGSLFGGRPGLKLRAVLFAGRLYVRAVELPSGWAVDFDATNLDLAQCQPLLHSGVGLNGRLFADGSLLATPAGLFGVARGRTRLVARGLSLRLTNGLAPLALERAELVARLKSGTLTVERIEAAGPGLALDGFGTLRLAPDWPRTGLDLTFRLSVGPAGRGLLGIALGLLPHPPESGPYHIRGTLASPAIS
jgi:type II secretion system protein N